MTDPIKAAAEPSGEALLALADEIEASEGLVKMQPLRAGPSQLGIKKTAQIVSALRRLAAPAGTTPKPFYGAECPAYPACDGGCGLGCTKEIERTHAAPPEASFDNASDMLGYLNAPREAEPVAWRWKPLGGTWRYAQSDASFPDGAGTLEGLYTSPSPIPDEPSIDLTNHHNALKCPYYNPLGLSFAPTLREEIIEECAKIADHFAIITTQTTTAECDEHARERARLVAAAIRALKPQDGGESGR